MQNLPLACPVFSLRYEAVGHASGVTTLSTTNHPCNTNGANLWLALYANTRPAPARAGRRGRAGRRRLRYSPACPSCRRRPGTDCAGLQPRKTISALPSFFPTCLMTHFEVQYGCQIGYQLRAAIRACPSSGRPPRCNHGREHFTRANPNDCPGASVARFAPGAHRLSGCSTRSGDTLWLTGAW